MFDNIGKKIKNLAATCAWIGIIGSIVLGIAIISEGSDDEAIIGILTAGVGALVSWVSSFCLYGFGQLIENTDIIAGRKGEIKESTTKNSVPSMNKTTFCACASCGAILPEGARFCDACGKKVD